MKRLDRLKTHNCHLPNRGSLLDLVDVTIQSYFRLNDDEFNEFFNHFTDDELSFLIPPVETTQTFTERREVSKMLENFYINVKSQ